MTLTTHLAMLDEDAWEANFQEVEEVLGFPLPDSARQYPAWWANQGRSQSLAWQSAGWKTSAVDVNGERVTFVRTASEEGETDAAVAKLTISEAKAGLAANFGVPVESIEIHIRG